MHFPAAIVTLFFVTQIRLTESELLDNINNDIFTLDDGLKGETIFPFSDILEAVNEEFSDYDKVYVLKLCPTQYTEDKIENIYNLVNNDDNKAEYSSRCANTTQFNYNLEEKQCWMTNSTTANCSYLHLFEIPTNLPNHILVLDFDCNRLVTVPNFALTNYTQLRYLSLSTNMLYYLCEHSFYGLENLETLILSDNTLLFAGRMTVFPDNVFHPLVSLTTLELDFNNREFIHRSTVYPDKALSSLTRLRTLYIDVPVTPGPVFANLTNLVEFVSGYCYFSSLANDSFIFTPHLERLTLRNCKIQGDNIHAGAFEPLVNLSQNIGFENLDKIFYGLRNATKLKKLHLRSINDKYSLGVCLKNEYFTHFPPNVEYLDIQENNIEAIDRHVVEKLPASLKTIDISGNSLVLGQYFLDFHNITNLRKLIANGAKTFSKLPTLYPNKSSIVSNQTDLNSSCSNHNMSNKIKFHLLFPPDLAEIEMNDAGLKFLMTYLHVNSSNNVQKISLRGNYFPVLVGPIFGFHRLEHLDLSQCQIASMFPPFFRNLTSLTFLNLSNNFLGHAHGNTQKKNIYKHQINLQVLDISSNSISRLTEGILDHLVSLKELYLDNNVLLEFRVIYPKMSIW